MPFEPSDTTFADRAGRTWRVVLTLGREQTIRAECGLDLAGSMRDIEPFYQLLTADTLDIVSAVWVCVREDAAALGVDRDAFLDAIDAPALRRLRAAFVLAVADLYPAWNVAAAVRLGGAERVIGLVESIVTRDAEKVLGILTQGAGG